MTARKPIGTIASTLILTGLAAGTFLILAVAGGVFGGRNPSAGSSAAAHGVADPTTRPSADVGTARVSIDNFSFSPAEITVAAGTKVTWVNHDDVPHTVTADDKSFNSGALDTDDQYSQVFAKAGEYPYFCGLHPHMTGRVIVK
jgi:plastocyanin